MNTHPGTRVKAFPIKLLSSAGLENWGSYKHAPVIAVLYDVHGNLQALDAVLADARAAGASHWVLGGDYALFGAWPAETVARLRELEPASWIRGNVDRWAGDPAAAPGTRGRATGGGVSAAAVAGTTRETPTTRHVEARAAICRFRARRSIRLPLGPSL